MNNKTKNIVTSLVFITFIAVFVVLCTISSFNPVEYSSLEKRPMAQFPTDFTFEELINNETVKDPITGEDVKSPIGQFEDYAVDQFPFREFFRYIKAHFAMDILGIKENNGYIVENGSIGQLTTEFDKDSVEYAIGRLEAIYEMFLKNNGGNKYVCIVPDKSYYFGQQYGYPVADYEALFNKVKETLPDMEYIDVTGDLTLEDYYKTDWHWDQKNLLDVLKTLADKMGFSDRLSWEYTENVFEDYRGGYWDMSGLYPMKAEKLTYLTNNILNDCTVFDKAANMTTGLYNKDLYNTYTKYDFFLSADNGGWRGIQIIENPNATTDKEIVIFRDSFGSSIIPLIAEGYKTIHVVDIRAIMYPTLSSHIDFEGKDVLFLYSATVLNTKDFK